MYIEFTDDMLDPDTGKQLQGDCIWLDDNSHPREFKIRVNAKQNRKSQLTAIAHELVHVKQYAINDLRDMIRGPTNVKWKKEYVHESKMHYFDLPWEIEAYGRESGMYLRYMEHKKLEKLMFNER